jgi:RNA polymerase sigma-70 factor (ECF subfamily)
MTPVTLVEGSGTARRQFEQLIQPHFSVLHRVAFRFTGTEHDAEDLVQETCVRAYRHLDKLSRLDNPRAWLLHVMQNLFIDSTRRYENTNVIPLDAAPDGRVQANQPSVEEAVDAEQAAHRITLSLRKLGKEHRSLLVLHDVEGYSLSELGEITGLKIGTIKSRLHRARVKLGRMLEADEHLSETLSHEGSGT